MQNTRCADILHSYHIFAGHWSLNPFLLLAWVLQPYTYFDIWINNFDQNYFIWILIISDDVRLLKSLFLFTSLFNGLHGCCGVWWRQNTCVASTSPVTSRWDGWAWRFSVFLKIASQFVDVPVDLSRSSDAHMHQTPGQHWINNVLSPLYSVLLKVITINCNLITLSITYAYKIRDREGQREKNDTDRRAYKYVGRLIELGFV